MMQHNGFLRLQKLVEARGLQKSRTMSVTREQPLRGAEAWSAALVLSARMTRWGTRSRGTGKRCPVPESAGRTDSGDGRGISRVTIWTGPPEVLGPWVVVES